LWGRSDPWIQLLHLLGADLYWITIVLLAAETIWPAEVSRPVSIDHPA